MRQIILFSVLALFFIIPISVGADEAQGLVTCSGPDCNFCTFFAMVNGVIAWIISIMTLVAVFVLVFAGFRLVTSGGDPGALQKAKEMITNVLIGFVIMLAAWVIVDTIIKTLTGSDYGVWEPVTCGKIVDPLEDSKNSGASGAW